MTSDTQQYGLEGGESMLPALDSLFSAASQGTTLLTRIHQLWLTFFLAGVQHIILGTQRL